MASFSPQTIWNLPNEELLNLLDSQVFIREPRRINFYAPGFMPYHTSNYHATSDNFPTISITGNACALNCKHCEGKVLQTMHPATTPQKLLALCTKIRQNGALGCLISGGCLPNGSVPIEPFISTIAKIKRDLGLTVLVHTGIIDFATAKQLKTAAVDAALIDVIGADETIHQTFNLNITTKNYHDSLKALQDAKLDFVPHVIVGLHNGELKGEFAALQMISQYTPSAVVIIAFMPIHKTAMAKITPSTPIDIARTAATARIMFPRTPLVLGCMRPKGKHRQETDTFALKTGIDAIAYPTETAIQQAQNSGYNASFSPFCCAQIYKDISK